MANILSKRYLIPPVGRSPIIFGLIIASICGLAGFIFILMGATPFPSRWHNLTGRDRWLWVEGVPAIFGGLSYLCLGLYLHAAYYWPERKTLCRHSTIFANVALAFALILGAIAVIME